MRGHRITPLGVALAALLAVGLVALFFGSRGEMKFGFILVVLVIGMLVFAFFPRDFFVIRPSTIKRRERQRRSRRPDPRTVTFQFDEEPVEDDDPEPPDSD